MTRSVWSAGAAIRPRRKEFIDFVGSEEGQLLAARQGLSASLTPGSAGGACPGLGRRRRAGDEGGADGLETPRVATAPAWMSYWDRHVRGTGAARAMSEFLRLEGLVKRFDGVVAVDGLSLALERGELLALLGPSGSGKTTTLRLLAGFETPDAGRVDSGRRGRDAGRARRATVRHGLPALRALPPSRRRRERRVRPGVAGRAGRRPAGPSGAGARAGGSRRVRAPPRRPALGRPAAARRARPSARPRAPVLLLDEPLSNLDPTLRERTRREIRELIRRVGHHHRARHPRAGRGVRPRRPRRGAAGRAAGAGRQRPTSCTARRRISSSAGSWAGRARSRSTSRSVTAQRRAGGWWTASPGRSTRRPVARSRDRVRRSCWCGPSRCGSVRRATGAVPRDGHRAALRRRRVRCSPCGPSGGETVEIVAPPAAARPGDRVGVLPSRRAGGGIHLFQGEWRDQPRAFPARRARAPPALLAWLVVYPIVLVLLEGVRGPAAGRSIRPRLPRSVRRVARVVGQPLDLARERGARGRDRPPARLSLLRYEFPGGRILGAVVALPAVLPPLVGVLAFLFLYGESGFVSLAGPAAARAGGAAVAARGRRGGAAGARLLDVRLLLSVHAGRARVARRLAARGGGEPRRRAVAHRSGASCCRCSIPRSAARPCSRS